VLFHAAERDLRPMTFVPIDRQCVGLLCSPTDDLYSSADITVDRPEGGGRYVTPVENRNADVESNGESTTRRAGMIAVMIVIRVGPVDCQHIRFAARLRGIRLRPYRGFDGKVQIGRSEAGTHGSL
jgi:hypothetical protein